MTNKIKEEIIWIGEFMFRIDDYEEKGMWCLHLDDAKQSKYLNARKQFRKKENCIEYIKKGFKKTLEEALKNGVYK